MIRLKTGGGFGSDWVTPEILFALSRPTGAIFLALNKEYKIFLEDLRGKLLRVIEMPYKIIKLGREGRRSLLAKFKGGNVKAIEAAFPDELIALGALKSLPRGWLAAFRVTGVEKLEVDVFDPEGKYVYRLMPPPGIILSDAVFHETGFAVNEEKGDCRVYRDYRITNLPEFFEFGPYFHHSSERESLSIQRPRIALPQGIFLRKPAKDPVMGKSRREIHRCPGIRQSGNPQGEENSISLKGKGLSYGRTLRRIRDIMST